MDVKAYLKQICDLEQTRKETEMKIPKHKEKKSDTEKRIKKKREALEGAIVEQQNQINTLVACRKSSANFVFAGIEKEKRTTIMVCVITAIIQALITIFSACCFGTNNFGAIAIVYTAIYFGALAFILYLEYDLGFKFPIFLAVIGIAILGLLYHLTYWYFKCCNGFGINIIGANIISTLVIIAIEIAFGVYKCTEELDTQRRAYYRNKKWLKDSEIQLSEMINELKLKKQKLVNFNRSSTAALAKMDEDIINLEKFNASIKNKLRGLYSQNILHPNYQNWVAAATIYEYLDVGRCYELKGPDGAYNLFEQELMAKKIIDSLSAIHSSINYHGSTLYNSQMYIRNQLSECNRNVERIVVNTYGF